MIGYLRPKLIHLDETQAIVKIRGSRRSKNHLNSMYFGALAVGADLAGGLHSFYFAKKMNVNASVAFKSFHADFLRRPESDVYFVCSMGKTVKDMLQRSQQSGQRVNEQLQIDAFTNFPDMPECVAKFTLELSVKLR